MPSTDPTIAASADPSDVADLSQATVTSLYGLKLRAPLVALKIKDVEVMMPPAKARELAAMLSEAASQAEVDGFLYEFVSQRLGANESQAGQILLEFRGWRAAERLQT